MWNAAKSLSNKSKKKEKKERIPFIPKKKKDRIPFNPKKKADKNFIYLIRYNQHQNLYLKLQKWK